MKKAIFILSILYAHCFGFAQSSKKETLSFYKSISKLDTNDIKQGKHLELARTFSIEEFVRYYLVNGKLKENKKYRLEILPLCKDSSDTYFVQKHSYGVLDLFKVNTKNLTELNYEELDRDTLRNKFIDEIVLEADKKKIEIRSKDQTMFFENPLFTYFYNKITKRILFKYQWKLNGDFGVRIINKTYTAEYDIASKQFINPGIN